MSANDVKGQTRILLLDGDPLFRSLVASILREKYVVSAAGNLSDATYELMEHVPDVVMIGVESFGSNELQTLQTLRRFPQLKQARFVLLTADTSRSGISSAMRAGADDSIDKGTISKRTLDDTLQRLLSFLPENRRTESFRQSASIANISPVPRRPVIAAPRSIGALSARAVR